MGESIGADAQGDLDLEFREQRTAHRRTQQVFAPVDRTCTQSRPNEFRDELVPQVLDVAFVGTGGDGFVADSFELVALPDITSDADDPCVVILSEPWDDDGRVEAARIRKYDCLGHRVSNNYSKIPYI